MKKTLFCLLLLITGTGFAAIQPIPVDQAFQLKGALQQKHLMLHWQIAPGYQLYRERIQVKSIVDSPLHLDKLDLPRGILKTDKILGHYQIYQHQLTLSLPLLNYQNGEFRIIVNYQGCSAAGYCYPPQQRLLTLQISPFGAQVQSIEKMAVQIAQTQPSQLAQKSLWLTLLTFFGLGILLAFTPCVLPMVPILSGIIVGQKQSTRQAFLLSLTYVLAMALAYAIAGVLAGLLGKNLQAALQTPAVIIVFALLFVILACSLFGFYELRLPHKWQQQLTLLSQRQKSGSYLGVAIMGALSILVVSPCISAPLVAALAYISQTGHATLGGLILFVMGLGMGTPLLVIGTLEGKFLPKAGEWMNTVKIILGVLLLITAIWLLYRLLPGNICLILWGLIASTSAVYLGVFKFSNIKRRTILWHLILWLWLVSGILFLVGGILGNQDPMHPLNSKRQHPLHFHKYKTFMLCNRLLIKSMEKQ